MNKTGEETKENPEHKSTAAAAAASNETPLGMPDVGIFSGNPTMLNQESSLEGFVATFEKARSTRHEKDDARDGRIDITEEADETSQEHEDKKNNDEVSEFNGTVRKNHVARIKNIQISYAHTLATRYNIVIISAEMPAAKKQCTTSSTHSSPLLKCHSDIFQNVYSFLTLKAAVVLRRTCQELYLDENLFRFSILGSIQRIIQGGELVRRLSQGEELALYNLANAANVCALFGNETLPAHIAKDYIHNLIAKSRTDNGEAVSIALQDGRCRVEARMLDKALRKDFTAMAAALQQDETVRAAVQLCSTCGTNIACYTCFKGKTCKNLKSRQKKAKTSDDNLLPKYCKNCIVVSNMLFCKCGEAVCRNKCSQRASSCEDCHAIVCGQAGCMLEECEECEQSLLCDSCGPWCSPCYAHMDDYRHHSDDYYSEYYGYNDDSDHDFY